MPVTIFDIYIRDPAYFQRMVESILLARFKTVRLFLEGENAQANDRMFISTDGTIVDMKNNKRRFATLTGWANSVYHTNYSLSYTEIFHKIHATRRVTLMDVLTGVDIKERDAFIDLKYRSSIAYEYIAKRMESKPIPQSIPVDWRGNRYYVSANNTTTDKQGLSVIRFLNAVCEQETKDLYYVLDNPAPIDDLKKQIDELHATVEALKAQNQAILAQNHALISHMAHMAQLAMTAPVMPQALAPALAPAPTTYYIPNSYYH